MSKSLLLCVECGRLCEAASSSPYRQVEAVRRGCEGCGALGLVDPRSPDAALLLHGLDDEQRLARAPAGVRAMARLRATSFFVLAALAVSAICVALYFGKGKGDDVSEVLSLLFAAGIGLPMGMLGMRALRSTWKQSRALPRPARWRLELPVGAERDTHRRRLDPAQVIVSPLSGRPCAAYEIGVRCDDDADAPLGSWLLLEQGFAADERLQLDFPRMTYTPADPALAKAFLDARGISPATLDLHFFETLVPVGAEVSASVSGDGVTILRS